MAVFIEDERSYDNNLWWFLLSMTILMCRSQLFLFCGTNFLTVPGVKNFLKIYLFEVQSYTDIETATAAGTEEKVILSPSKWAET